MSITTLPMIDMSNVRLVCDDERNFRDTHRKLNVEQIISLHQDNLETGNVFKDIYGEEYSFIGVWVKQYNSMFWRVFSSDAPTALSDIPKDVLLLRMLHPRGLSVRRA